MKTIYPKHKNLQRDRNFRELCAAAGAKILAQIDAVKAALFAEFRDAFATEQPLRLAIVEAEALAWQTDYPHLIFPALAGEKIQRAAQWQARQQFLRQDHSAYALAA
jgi:hypothetical protein